MIRLKPELFQGLDTVEGLRKALQTAIQLEFSTIPPYLYALYSLKDPKSTVYDLIRSVVIEEMLHMALACNLLNAIGGKPVIDDRAVVPRYPGHLPGGVEGSLTVSLKPLSRDLVKDVFMAIEEPEEPIPFGGCELAGPRQTDQGKTIGDFYTQIKENMKRQGETIFTGDPARQVTDQSIDGSLQLRSAESHRKLKDLLIAVTDLASAVEAIDTIVEQGDSLFTKLLSQLQETFNGNPPRFADAVDEMYVLVSQAQKLINIDLGDGTYAGPSFEYYPLEHVKLETLTAQGGPDPHLFGLDTNGELWAIELPKSRGGVWIKSWPKPPV